MIPKFRAWDKHVKKIRKVTEIHFDDSLIYLKANNGKGYYCSFSDIELMQSTGLRDKNGVDIYEGDILKGEQNIISSMHVPPFKSGVIKYSERNTMFYLDDGSKRHDLFISLGGDIYTYEVIGNIYENSEFLEGK